MARHRFGFEVLAVAGAAGLVALGVLGARAAGWLERLELATYDHQAKLAASGPETDSRVVLIEVNERDIQTLGKWPLSDEMLARVIEIAGASGARAIGVDIYRDIPVPPGSEQLDAVLARDPRVIFIAKFGDDSASGVAPPAALAGTEQVGANNILVDRDGIVRRGLLFMDDSEGGTGYSFALRLALLYLAEEGIQATADPDDPALLRLGQTTFRPLVPSTGSYAGADTGGYQFLLDFRGAAEALPSITLRDLLKEGGTDPSFFRDRIVIVGLTAESVPDLFHIAFESDCSLSHACLAQGVGIAGATLAGQMASQIVRYALGVGSTMRTLAEWQEALLVVLFSALGATLGLWTRSIWRLALFGSATVAVLWLIGLAFLVGGWWIPIMPLAAACLASGSAVTAYLTSRERAERTELMQLFSRHVTKQVAEEVWRHRDEFLEGGRPKSERLTATILFVDMKDYTSRAEKLDPEDLMVWLNGYLECLSQDVLDAGGLVEDYFGDGMMACFGIPIPHRDLDDIKDDARSAVLSALAMADSVRQLNTEWNGRGLPSVGIRVGVCSGEVVTGSLGSNQRLKYSVVGDVVVTAQRLQALDDTGHDFEAEPCRILIGEQTRDYVAESVLTREFGEIVLKGKAQPTMVHRVLGRVTPRTGVPSETGGNPR